MNSLQALLLVSVAGIGMTSCVVSDYRGRPVAATITPSFGIYDVLPETYSGDAYYYHNRYYYGGNYQRGVFHDHGRQYSDRYYHGGQYYYGGRTEHHVGRSQIPTRRHNSRTNDRDHDHR